MTEVSPNAVTMSREEREICRMTGASIAAFTKARAKRLAGVDPVSGKAIPDVTEQPGLRPYPDPAADDDDRLAHRIPRDLVANTRHVVRFPKRAAARR